MNSNEDRNALFSSEIFTTYVNNELKKEAEKNKMASDNIDNLLSNFESLQNKINSSKKLKEAFKKMQYVLRTNKDYASKVDKNFISGILLLDIED